MAEWPVRMSTPALRPGESVRAGLARVAAVWASQARVPAIRGLGEAEQIHEVRVALKRMRALWRLLQPVVGETVSAPWLRDLRESGQTLALFRDRTVIGEGLAKLALRKKAACLRPFLHLYRLRQGPEEGGGNLFVASSLRQAVRLLEDSARAVAHLTTEARGRDLLEPGLQRAVRRFRRATRQARRTGTTEALHEWRKRTKDLTYQLELVAPLGRKGLDGRIRSLRRLGELLGTANDWALVRAQLDRLPGEDSATVLLEEARRFVEDRRRKLIRQALRLARCGTRRLARISRLGRRAEGGAAPAKKRVTAAEESPAQRESKSTLPLSA